MAFPLSLAGSELAIYPHDDAVTGAAANGQNVTFLTDYSGKGRTLVGTVAYPIYQIPSVNGKAAAVWDGTKTPLKNTETFTIRCGFMVVRIDEATFSNYAGILTDTNIFPILVGNTTTTFFNDNAQQPYLYEFRSDDRIYSRDAETDVFNAPAPMNAYKIIFFRYWTGVTLAGIQVGQDRLDTTRKAKMSLALLALYSSDFCESDVRAMAKQLATTFALTLTDVFPFQADADTNYPDTQAANIDFPSSGGQIAETLGGVKVSPDLKFTGRLVGEVRTARAFLRTHFAKSSFVYRSYAMMPPEDYAGYATTLLDHTGDPVKNNKSYGFSFKEN